MPVRLIHSTPKAEKHIAFCAKVSSPTQDSPEIDKLLSYCIKNKHWSIFEMASMCVEIKTTRAISQQIIRHRSFHFQEFSQRYSEVSFGDLEFTEPRRQDTKNRQNSIDDLPDSVHEWFLDAQEQVTDLSMTLYHEALKQGIAKECARFLLPMNIGTKVYMHGTVRDWIHYIELRTGNGTQKEHMELALECKRIFTEQFPIISKALGWKE